LRRRFRGSSLRQVALRVLFAPGGACRAAHNAAARLRRRVFLSFWVVMSTIRIANTSVSVVISGYAIAEIEGEPTVVYLDIAPQHPKSVGAVWASLVNGAKESLRLSDGQTDQSLTVQGLARRYHRLTVDAPRVAGRARPKHVRLIAPLACQIEHLTRPFVVLAWTWTDPEGQEHRLTPATSLAAMLEHHTPLPILLDWSEYLLAEAISGGFAKLLVRGGDAPEGYLIEPAPWEDIISAGIKSGVIRLAS
jgi:hypothetical protein